MAVEPKCEMCGVPFVEHDGLTLMCRRYHWLRAEIMDITNRAKERSREFLPNANQEVWGIVGHLEWVLDAAKNNDMLGIVPATTKGGDK